MNRLTGFVMVLALCSAAFGQALNIDVSGSVPVPAPPSAAFAGAGAQAGVWSSVVQTDWLNPLVDINGQPTAVTLQAAVGPSPYQWDTAGMTGDYKALLDSAWYCPNHPGLTATVSLTLSGLSNGSYTVYLYSYFAGYSFSRNVMCLPSVEQTATVSGQAPVNTLVAGVTHAVFHSTVTDGSLMLIVTAPDFYPCFVNGLQIVPDGPLPTCTITQQPANVREVRGATATFGAAISGDVRSYQWLKNGVPLVDGPGITGSNTPVLTLMGLADLDAGMYSLRYACGGSLLTTDGATLTVLPGCGSADFNGDGDIGTDADIEAFFRVLAGGSC